MSYNYQKEKPFIFTESGSVAFLRIRDRVQGWLKEAGAIRMESAIRGHSGSNWEAMACVDRMVEIGELREVSEPDCAGQHRLFVSNR